MRYTGIFTFFLGLIILLTGCSGVSQTGFEQVADDIPVSSAAPQYSMVLATPADTQEVAAFSGEQLYAQSEGALTITTQVLQADHLDGLLRELTGLSQDHLTLMTTWQDGLPRHDLTWTAAGEGGMEVYRSVILDDGTYYYIATAAVPEEQAAAYANQIKACFSGAMLTSKEESALTAP